MYINDAMICGDSTLQESKGQGRDILYVAGIVLQIATEQGLV